MSEAMALNQKLPVAEENKTAANPVNKVMRGSYLSVSENLRTGEVLEMIRSSCLKNDQLNLVFVSGRSGRYSGFVRLSTLLRSPEHLEVKTLAKGRDLYVTEQSDQEAAARLLQKKDIPMLPVVDENQRLQGVLTFDAAMDILEEEASEDIYWKAGVGDVLHYDDAIRSEKLTQGGIGYSLKVRIAFLMVTLTGGLLVGGLIDHFEGALEALVALAIFIPLVMDMGGNVGTQSSTIFARGLALGHIQLKGFFKNHLWRELKVGLSMGLLLATIAGTIAYFWQGAPNDLPLLGVVVGVALMFSVTTASVLGFLLPWILLKLGVDHAPGADPFITTIKDFTGLLVYFLMAAWLLGVSA